MAISTSPSLDAHSSYSIESVSIARAYSVSFCRNTGCLKLNLVGVVDSVTPSVSIAIPILTAGVSISTTDSITAPAAPRPTPFTTTDGGSVYPLPESETSQLYTLPSETEIEPVAEDPPGN